MKNGHQPFEPENTPVHVGLTKKHTRIVDKITRGKIICAIDDNVIHVKNFERISARQLHVVCSDFDKRINFAKCFPGRFDFALSQFTLAMNNLPFKIYFIHKNKKKKKQKNKNTPP